MPKVLVSHSCWWNFGFWVSTLHGKVTNPAPVEFAGTDSLALEWCTGASVLFCQVDLLLSIH